LSDDDEIDGGQPAQASRAQQVRSGVNKEIIAIDSASDADGSDMDVVILPGPPIHKRSRADGSSQDGSPHTAARNSMKRRATPVDPPGLVGTASLQDLQARRDALAAELQLRSDATRRRHDELAPNLQLRLGALAPNLQLGRNALAADFQLRHEALAAEPQFGRDALQLRRDALAPNLHFGGDALTANLQAPHRAWPPIGTPPDTTLTPSGPSRSTYRKSKSSKNQKEPGQAPYYVDGRLEAKMFRGPGYERFPVVLGTVEGHQQLCDKWDNDLATKRQKRLAKLQRLGHTIYDSESSSDDDFAVEHNAAFEKRCLDHVVEVFPDIERAFIQKRIRDEPPKSQDAENDDEDLIALGPPSLAEKIISEVLEMQAYPKERASNAAASGKGSAIDDTGITITWNRALPKDDMYTKDGTILIAKHFPHVPSHFVGAMMKEKKSIFDTFLAIHELEDQYYTVQAKPYARRKQPRSDLERKYLLKASDRRIPAEYANRVNELQAAKQHVTREAIKEAAKKAKEEAEALNLAEHIKSGAIMECQCCYDAQVPLNRIVPCTADVPHNFCFTCVEGLADTQVGMLQHEMLCMDDSGCDAKLSHEDIGRAIPITTFDRLELNQQQAEIMAANIEGLEQCSWCEYKAICGDIKEEPVFFCQNPECSRATCRRCKKDHHAPKTCEEASVDKVLSARHLVEEARSDAIIRICQKCSARILKDFGCNKMYCTRCGSSFCYVCNDDITDVAGGSYNHFGQGCILYDEPGYDRHEKEAREAEQEAISKAKAMNADLDESQLRIIHPETNPRTAAMQNLLDHPAGGVFMRDINNRALRMNNRELHLQNMQARLEALEARRPDREIGQILAEARAMTGNFGMDNIPPPEVRLQQLRQLQELQRRAQRHR
jgi:TRIAD3 protein (E3 ubiquitin-protein ligase RNF216)